MDSSTQPQTVNGVGITPPVIPSPDTPPAPMGYQERLAQAANQIGVLPGIGGWAKSLIAAHLAALPRRPVAPSPVQQPQTPAAQPVGQPATSPAAPPQNVPPAAQSAQRPNNAALVGQGINTIAGSLGDASHAVGPGGVLGGIARTLEARGERLSREDANRIQMAEANVRMQHEQALTHQVGEQAIQSSIDAGTKAVQSWQQGADPAPIIARDLTFNELQDYLRNKKVSVLTQTPYPTGRRQVGENPDGTPQYATTYTVLGTPPSKTLDPNNPDDKIILDRLNQFAPPSGGGTWQGKQNQPITFEGATLHFMLQTAADKESQMAAARETAIKNGLTEDELSKNEEFLKAKPEVTNALANVPGAIENPLKAVAALSAMKNQDGTPKYPNAENDVRQALGVTPAGWETIRGNAQKAADKNASEITDLVKKVDASHGEDAAALSKGIQQKLDDNPAMDFAQRQQLIKLQKQADVQARASLSYDAQKEQRQKEISNAIETGDTDALVDAALNYQLDPNKLYSMRKDTNAQFKAKMLAKDPTWSEPVYRARYNTAQQFTPEGKGGLAVQSLNTFAGHAGDANDLITSLQNTNSPLANKALNKIKVQLGNDKVGPYIASLEAAKTEYENFLNNQHALTQSDKDLSAKLLDENTSPAAAQATLRQMANTIAIRAKSLNSAYKATMGKDVPDLLQPDSQQTLRNFGINVDGIFNPASHIGNPNTAQMTPQGRPNTPPANMTHMQKPDGTFIYVPNAQVAAAQNLGAKVVQ